MLHTAEAITYCDLVSLSVADLSAIISRDSAWSNIGRDAKQTPSGSKWRPTSLLNNAVTRFSHGKRASRDGSVHSMPSESIVSSGLSTPVSRQAYSSGSEDEDSVHDTHRVQQL